MSRYIALTVDYEIFGNGMGDVKQHITEPTERMARICEKYGAPLTVYLEAEEYLAFERNRTELIKTIGYDPAKLIREQAAQLAANGHDYQLHLHPEWVGTRYENGQWILNEKTLNVDSLFETTEETIEYIRERKETIEDLISGSGPQKKICAYRAGAFRAQPGQKLIPALAANGFTIDSSVVKGYYQNQEFSKLDYKHAPANKHHWRVTDDVASDDNDGLITEVPIYSRIGRRMQQITLKRFLAKFSKNIPKEKQREMVSSLGMGKSPKSIAKFLLQKFPIKLDFHNMTSSQLMMWIKKAPKPTNGDLDILVLIGHTKEHTNDKDFDAFLSAVSKDPDLEVVSLSQVSEMLQNTGVAH